MLNPTQTPPFVAAMIIPTGTGASIGGFAGDATPYMNLLASVTDVLITHPNVANAAVFQKLPDNVLYVEGYALDQFMQGNWALQPMRKNRIGVVFDAAITPDMLTLHLNTINAAKTVYGLDIVGYVLTDQPVETVYELTPSGCSGGRLKNPATILSACLQLLEKGATAIALCTCLPEELTSLPPENDDGSGRSAEAEDGDPKSCEEPESDIADESVGLSEAADADAEISRSALSAQEGERSHSVSSHQASEASLMKEMALNMLLGNFVTPDLLSEHLSSEEEPMADDAEEADAPANVARPESSDASGALPSSEELEARYRNGEGVDPIGGLEGILSHLVVSELGVPCAHAPVFSWETARPVTDQVLDPRAAAEFIAPTFLPCVLTGLSRAPQMPPLLQAHPLDISVNNLSALVAPADALGGPAVLAALEHGVTVLAVEGNRTVLSMTKDCLLLAPEDRLQLIIPTASYEEAAGRLQLMRLGLTVNTEPVANLGDSADNAASTPQTGVSNAPESPHH